MKARECGSAEVKKRQAGKEEFSGKRCPFTGTEARINDRTIRNNSTGFERIGVATPVAPARATCRFPLRDPFLPSKEH